MLIDNLYLNSIQSSHLKNNFLFRIFSSMVLFSEYTITKSTYNVNVNKSFE